MMRWVGLLAGAMLVVGCRSAAPPVVDRPVYDAAAVTMADVTFSSSALGRVETYRVFRPKVVAVGVRLPVVYLLHGNGGGFRDWSQVAMVSRLAEAGYLLVMPEGHGGYFMNSATRAGDRYEDFMTKDLVADVDGRFRTRAERGGRAIVGVSMGGFGALVLGMKHAEEYGFVGALSAPVEMTHRRFTVRRWGQSMAMRSIFGGDGSVARRENDPFALAAHADAGRVPFLFVSVGEDESLREPNERFEALLVKRGIGHRFQEMPGGHDWGEWERQMPLLFRMLEGVIAAG